MNNEYLCREVIVSKIIPKDIIKELKTLGITTKFIQPSCNLTSELKYHPDILTFKLPSGKLLCEDNFIKLSDKYPNDCVYNCATVGNTLVYGNPSIANRYGDLFERLIHVKQGYVKCSTVVLNENAVISSDRSIEKALGNDFDVLYVTNNGIELNGYNCGFIGGACGVIEKNILFFGDIKKHCDYRNIKSFSENHGFYLHSLTNGTLYDYGGIIPV